MKKKLITLAFLTLCLLYGCATKPPKITNVIEVVTCDKDFEGVILVNSVGDIKLMSASEITPDDLKKLEASVPKATEVNIVEPFCGDKD